MPVRVYLSIAMVAMCLGACSRAASTLTPAQQQGVGQLLLDGIPAGTFERTVTGLTRDSTARSNWVVTLFGADVYHTPAVSFSLRADKSGALPVGQFRFDEFLYDNRVETLFQIKYVDPVTNSTYFANGVDMTVSRLTDQYTINWAGTVRKGLLPSDTTTYLIKGQYVGPITILP